MSDYERTFGENFAAARQAAGITQQWIAEHIGKRQSFVSKIELGQQTLSLNDAVTLAALLGLPLHALLDAGDLTAARLVGEEARTSERVLRQKIADEIMRGF